ncbi:hypothetical protein SBA6_730001 [Candidatus Sulfopaludibacter sp. SbA6]|nr:hypothetical protein SBA6_730001 [Candidatus Sulfopaludibacter sp. SbA6]
MIKGSAVWNQWRKEPVKLQKLEGGRRRFIDWLDLSQARLGSQDLSGADLSGTNLSRANLSGADLSGADLREANRNCSRPYAC